MRKYDTNDSGFLDLKELADLLLDLNDGVPLSVDEVRSLLGAADRNDDGQIDMDELYQMLERWYLAKDSPEMLHMRQCNICVIM